MAAANPAETLQDEATCSICLDFFQDPVMITDCGHNFCRNCIDKTSKRSDGRACCPECRCLFFSTNLRPNRQLGNMAETAKQLSVQMKNSSKTERHCTQHQKPLTRFCKTDVTLVCQVCERSKAHQGHAVVHTEVAAGDYKKALLKHLENLKTEKTKIQTAKSNGEMPSQDLLKEVQAKRQEIVSGFQQQRQLLEQQEQLQLSKLRDLEKEIEMKRDDYVLNCKHEISCITDLIGDVEKKDKQPANEFLQDIGSILNRCQKGKFHYPAVPDSSDIRKRFNQFCQESTSLKSSLKCKEDAAKNPLKQSVPKHVNTAAGAAKKPLNQNMPKPVNTAAAAVPCPPWPVMQPAFPNSAPCFLAPPQSMLPSAVMNAFGAPMVPLWQGPSENRSNRKWIKENVLLDPETAHPRYIVSDDWKSVRWGDSRQDFPYSPKRFEYIRCVLGYQGFTSGKHYWIVDVQDGDYWAVGVARGSVERGEEIDLEPDEGIWAIGRYNDQYKALTSPPTVLDVQYDPTEIQVSLNYEAGAVYFYDAEDRTRLYAFQSEDFEGEEIFPFFRITDSSTVLELYS